MQLTKDVGETISFLKQRTRTYTYLYLCVYISLLLSLGDSLIFLHFSLKIFHLKEVVVAGGSCVVRTERTELKQQYRDDCVRRLTGLRNPWCPQHPRGDDQQQQHQQQRNRNFILEKKNCVPQTQRLSGLKCRGSSGVLGSRRNGGQSPFRIHKEKLPIPIHLQNAHTEPCHRQDDPQCEKHRRRGPSVSL